MLALLLLVTVTQSEADRLVQQLRLLPTPLPAMARSDGRVDPVELQRRDVYRQLRQLGDDALPALARGLGDPDVRLRKNVALAVGALAGTWWDRSARRMNIRPILGELIAMPETRCPRYARHWQTRASMFDDSPKELSNAFKHRRTDRMLRASAWCRPHPA